jgi:hypothetical protein
MFMGQTVMVLTHPHIISSGKKTIETHSCFSAFSICADNINTTTTTTTTTTNNNNNKVLHIYCLNLAELGLDCYGICTAIRELN